MDLCRLFFAGCFLCTSPIFSEQFGGVEFPQGAASFADRAYVSNPGSPPATAANYVNPSKATGPPDYNSPTGSYSLGRGGSIVLEFTNNLLTGSDNSDPDLYIFEIGPDVERTFVELSREGALWASIGTVEGANSSVDIDQFGFDSADEFRFVRLRDDPDAGDQTGVTVGADIDAVGAISTVPVADAPVLRIRHAGSNAYSRTILEGGPVAYWRFTEASGTVAENLGSLGPAANGSYGPHAGLDAPGLREDSVDPGLGFPFASVQSGMLVEGFPMPPDALSFSLLVSGDSPGDTCLFGYGAGSTPNEFSAFSSAGNLVLYLNSNRLDFPSLNVMDGDPHQLSITWTKDGGLLQVYLDGDPAASAVTSDGVPLDPNGVLALGQDLDSLIPPSYGFDPAQSLVGTVDEVAVFDRPLDPEEVGEQWAARIIRQRKIGDRSEVFVEWDSAAGGFYQLRESETFDLWDRVHLYGGTGGKIRLTKEVDVATFFFQLLSSTDGGTSE